MEIVRVEQVSKNFNGAFRLGPVDLCVAPGEVLGIIGPHSAGKTTLLRLLWGFIQPDGGRISIFGIQPHLNQIRVRRRAGYLPARPRLHSTLTAKEFLSFAGHFYDRWDEAYVSRLLEQLDIDPDWEVGKLSKRDTVQLGIVSAIGHRPALLILDEPTSRLEFLERLEILHFLNRIAREEHVSILISAHISDDLDHIADSVLMLKDGRAVEYARAPQIQQSCETPTKSRQCREQSELFYT